MLPALLNFLIACRCWVAYTLQDMIKFDFQVNFELT